MFEEQGECPDCYGKEGMPVCEGVPECMVALRSVIGERERQCVRLCRRALFGEVECLNQITGFKGVRICQGVMWSST